jgi:arylsulfatase
MIASNAIAQDTLPFPPKASGSKAGQTMQKSVYSHLPEKKHLPADAPFDFNGKIDSVNVKYTPAK